MTLEIIKPNEEFVMLPLPVHGAPMPAKLVLYKVPSVSKGTPVTSTPESHGPGCRVWCGGCIFLYQVAGWFSYPWEVGLSWLGFFKAILGIPLRVWGVLSVLSHGSLEELYIF